MCDYRCLFINMNKIKMTKKTVKKINNERVEKSVEQSRKYFVSVHTMDMKCKMYDK